MIHRASIIEVDDKFRRMCLRPYPGHRNGCPNYGCKPTCPPKCKKFYAAFRKPYNGKGNGNFFIIYTKFFLREHVERMRSLHPKWSKRQLYCCLYWQGRARKNLRAEIGRFKNMFPQHKVAVCPEAMGVNVTALMRDNAGIHLEWPPIHYAYQVAVAGLPK